MTVEDTELDVLSSAVKWAFVQDTLTVDKTAHTIKIRLTITAECFVQVYVNVQKSIISYTLVFNRSRIFGRDCDGGNWHRHPAAAPEQHDFSAEGRRPVSLDEFLKETQQVLQDRGLL